MKFSKHGGKDSQCHFFQRAENAAYFRVTHVNLETTSVSQEQLDEIAVACAPAVSTSAESETVGTSITRNADAELPAESITWNADAELFAESNDDAAADVLSLEQCQRNDAEMEANLAELEAILHADDVSHMLSDDPFADVPDIL